MRDALAIMKTLPRGIVAVETDDIFAATELHPAEAHLVAGAAEKRVREFAAGRACARQAMKKLGREPTPLLSNADRTPKWPSDIVGTITHTATYCASAVALSHDVAAVGIDAEQVDALDDAVLATICTRPELLWIKQFPKRERLTWGTVVFAAKEAFYKCQYTLTRTWLDFRDVAISVSANRFVIASDHPTVRALARQWPLSGEFFERDGTVVCTIALSQRAVRTPAGSLDTRAT